jgi:hypothetical protein
MKSWANNRASSWGGFLGRSGALRQLCYFGYEALPLAMAIACGLERRSYLSKSAC